MSDKRPKVRKPKDKHASGKGARRARRRRKRALIALCVVVFVVVGVFVFRARLPKVAKAALERDFPVLAEIGKISFSWPAKIMLEDVTLRRRSDKSLLCQIKRMEARYSLGSLLAARLDLESLRFEGVAVSAGEVDRALLKEAGALPDYPIQVRDLSVKISRETGSEERLWLDFSGVGLTFEPQASGCLAVEGSGNSAAMGRFRVAGVLGGELLDSRLTVSFPRLPLGPKVGRILPAQVVRIWEDLAPSGQAALSVELCRPIGASNAATALDLRARLSVNGASLRVPNLPDPVTDVDAVIAGTTGEFDVTAASGRFRSASLTCQARAARSGDAFGLRLRGNVRDLIPDQDVVKLFPDRARREIERLHLEGGHIDGDIELRFDALGGKPGGAGGGPDFVRASLSLRDCSMKPDWFPYQLGKVSGAFTIGLDEMVITSPLVGWHGGGSIKVTGTIGLSEERDVSELVVEADNLSVNEELKTAAGVMGDDVRRVWQEYAFRDGKLDAMLTMKGPLARDAKRDWTVRLLFDGCSGSYERFPYLLTGLTGQADIRPGRVSIKNLTGWHGAAPVRIAGWMDTRAGHRALNLEIRGTNVKLDGDLEAALDPEARKAWERFRPAGVADIEAVLSTPTKKGIDADVRVSALLKNCSARAPVGEKWLPLTDVTGRLELLGDVCRVTGLRARCLGGAATVSGTFVEAEGLTKLQGELAGDNFSVSELIALLPDELAERLRFLEPTGELSVSKLSVDVIQRPGHNPDVEYRCTAGLHDAKISIPMADVDESGGGSARLELSEIAGRLHVENVRGRPTVGSFELDKVRVLHGTMRNVVGKIKKTGPVFALEDVRGEMYGGHVEASFKGASDLLFFSGRARATGMDVARLCRETGLTNERVWGELRGTVQLNGERVVRKGEEPVWLLNGSGALRVDRANLGHTPLVKSILSYKTFLLGEGSVVEEAKASFEIDSQKLLIDEIVLSGPSLSTRGVGTLAYTKDMDIDLYFYRKARGSLLPSLPLVELIGKGLSWVVEKVQNQIIVVRVTGTLRDPKVSPAVLKDTGERIRRHIILNMWEEEKEEALSEEAEGEE